MIKTIKELNTHYYLSIVVLAVLFLLVFFKAISFGTPFPVTTTAEMYAIGITLLAIPVALKLFADKIKKIPEGTEKNETVRRYRNAWLLRIYIVNTVTMGNIFLYAISRNNNFMWLAVISFIVYMFCKPSHQDLENIVQEDKNVE
ncbi:MAG TPA: hypothetical protein GXX42_03685 [Petrimonas sp.]|uniref:hypothetical protein n=1 Tax=Petrimonas sp. TaxID=2023866 RepID=UPI00175CC621|nr:hypothetical protein [Petrimonas sp.]